jgi:hypothetical protein
MTPLIVPLDDGSQLVLTGLADGAAAGGAHTLDAADFVRDAVLAGVTGNFSYDLLKLVAIQLRARGFLSKPPPATSASVTATVTGHLTSTGYQAIGILRVAQLVDRSWTVEGTADGRPFDVRADPEGQVMQVRIG